MQIQNTLKGCNHEHNVKPNSCINPEIAKSLSKGFPTSSPQNIFRKINQRKNTVLIHIFVENGHKRTFLENLVKDYNAKNKSNGKYWTKM